MCSILAEKPGLNLLTPPCRKSFIELDDLMVTPNNFATCQRAIDDEILKGAPQGAMQITGLLHNGWWHEDYKTSTTFVRASRTMGFGTSVIHWAMAGTWTVAVQPPATVAVRKTITDTWKRTVRRSSQLPWLPRCWFSRDGFDRLDAIEWLAWDGQRQEEGRMMCTWVC